MHMSVCAYMYLCMHGDLERAGLDEGSLEHLFWVSKGVKAAKMLIWGRNLAGVRGAA